MSGEKTSFAGEPKNLLWLCCLAGADAANSEVDSGGGGGGGGRGRGGGKGEKGGAERRGQLMMCFEEAGMSVPEGTIALATASAMDARKLDTCASCSLV